MAISGGSGTGTSDPYGMNPFRIRGLPSTSQLNRMAGGFRTPPAGFQFGAPQIASGFTPSFGGVGSMDGMGDMGGRSRRQAGVLRMDKDGEKEPNKRNIGKRIMDLLSGESGAAIGGVAQGAGTAIGAYLNRRSNQEMTKLERDKFEEERRQEGLREKERERIRALLAPALDVYRPR